MSRAKPRPRVHPEPPALPPQVDAVVCAALNLADIAMSLDQRQIADEIYELANRLESTYEEDAS